MYYFCYVYVFLLLYMFHSKYCVSLCCSVYCLCVNMYPLTVNLCIRWLHAQPLYPREGGSYCQPDFQVQRYSWEVMGHPAWSLYLVHCDFHLFTSLKKPLALKRVASDANAKQAVTSQLQTLNIYFFCPWRQALVSQWDRCLILVLIVCKFDVYHSLHVCHAYI